MTELSSKYFQAPACAKLVKTGIPYLCYTVQNRGHLPASLHSTVGILSFTFFFFFDESLSSLKAQGQSQLAAVHQLPGEPHRCMGALRLPVPNTTSWKPDLGQTCSHSPHALTTTWLYTCPRPLLVLCYSNLCILCSSRGLIQTS